MIFYVSYKIKGLTDSAEEGTFLWESDNSKTTYTNWWGREPNNAGNEDCVHIRPQKLSEWNDSKCDRKYASGRANTALCQKY